MSDFDLGQLLRLQGAVRSTVGKGDPEPTDAPSLTEGYARMRLQLHQMVAGGELEAEFGAMFPEIPVFNDRPPTHGVSVVRWHNDAKAAAARAESLLGQLAGWIQGLIDERTLPDRIQAEAAEKVKQERQGFEGV